MKRKTPASALPAAVAGLFVLVALAGMDPAMAAPRDAGEGVLLDITMGGRSTGETFWFNSISQGATQPVALTVRDAAVRHDLRTVQFGQRGFQAPEHFTFGELVGPTPAVTGWKARGVDTDAGGGTPDGVELVEWYAASDSACEAVEVQCSPKLATNTLYTFGVGLSLKASQPDFPPKRFTLVAGGGAYNSDDTIPVIFIGKDTVLPTATLSVTGDTPSYRTDASFSLRLTASDAFSGLGALSITLDGVEKAQTCPAFTANTTATVTCDLTLTGVGDGIHVLHATATDVAGNPFSPTDILLKVDRTAPTTAIFADTNGDGAADQPNATTGWYRVTPAAIIEATDCLADCAGVGTLSWSRNGEAQAAPDLLSHPPYLVFAAVSALPEGIHSFTARAADAAHATPNQGGQASATFQVDTVAPAIQGSFDSPPQDSGAGYTLTFTFHDATSRLDRVDVSYAGTRGAANGAASCAEAFHAGATGHTCTLALPQPLDVGTHTYTATAADAAGNLATQQAVVVRQVGRQPQATFPTPEPPPPPPPPPPPSSGGPPPAPNGALAGPLRIAAVKAAFEDVPAASRVTLQALVTDTSRAPVAGAQVQWAVAAGNGTLPGAAAVTDGSGIAAAILSVGARPGSTRVTATLAGGGSASFTVTTVAGPAARLEAASPATLDVTLGAAPALRVRVVDAHGNPVGGHPVAWRVASGGGSLSAASTRTGDDGVAAATLAGGGATATVAATSANLSGSPVTFTVHAKVATRLQAAQASLTGILGAPQTLEAVATDADGNPRAGVPVAWSLAQGVGRLSNATSVTGADGKAATALTPLVAGTLQVRAASGALAGSPLLFTVTSLLPAPSVAGAAAPASWNEAVGRAAGISLPAGALQLDRAPDGQVAGVRDASGALVAVHGDPRLGVFLLRVAASGALVLVQSDGHAFPVQPQDGEVVGDALDPANRTRRVTVSVPAKEGWILVGVADPHPGQAVASLRSGDGRGIPLGLLWRQDGGIFFLDDPAVSYILSIEDGPAGSWWQGLALAAAAGAAVLAVGLAAALAWTRRRRARQGG